MNASGKSTRCIIGIIIVATTICCICISSVTCEETAPNVAVVDLVPIYHPQSSAIDAPTTPTPDVNDDAYDQVAEIQKLVQHLLNPSLNGGAWVKIYDRYLAIPERYRQPWMNQQLAQHFNGSNNIGSDQRRFTAHFATDKPIYRMGETIYWRASLFNAFTREPLLTCVRSSSDIHDSYINWHLVSHPSTSDCLCFALM